MSQVPPAILAGNFCPHAIWVGGTLYGTFNFLIKTRPAASRLKLVGRFIKGSIASAAHIGTFFIKIIVLAAKGGLCAFVQNNISFFWGEGIVLCHNIFMI